MQAATLRRVTSGEKVVDGGCKALLIDDDLAYCDLLRDYLEPYAYRFAAAHTGADGLQTAANGVFDIILLDMFLPDLHGLDVLKELRKHSSVPVVVLSAHNEEKDRIVALEMGADDYVPKSFSPRELLARLRAVLRRSAGAISGQEKEHLCTGELRIDKDSMQVALAGVAIPLTHIEFLLLYTLAKEPGRVFSREALLSLVCDRGFYGFDRSIDMHVSSLRRKLGDDSRTPLYIKTIRSAGYSFIRQEKSAEKGPGPDNS
ncbi:MAG: response regulator transcription factor [Desulfovibrio sp.]|nr:response regulator transcription factor [Desulfovibrio sp.]